MIGGFLKALVFGGAWVVLSTEILGAFGKINHFYLSAAWAWAFAFLAFPVVYAVKKNKDSLSFQTADINRKELLLLFVCAAISLFLLIIAVQSPPNDGDSIEYRMNRIMHWIQNSSVAHYPTHDLRELKQAPWGSFAMMHLMLLDKSDRFVNLMPWLSMIGCLAGVWLVAGELNLNKGAQVFSVVFCVTLPMGIFQATGPQMDYTVSLWLLSFVYFLLRWEKSQGLSEAAFAGLSLGLAILTRETAYFFSAPFFLWTLVRNVGVKKMAVFKLTAAVGGLAILINLGHYLRNQALFGNPVSETSAYGRLLVDHMNPALFVSNVLRNLSFHLRTPVWFVNEALYRFIEWAHGLLGVSSNDPRITFPGRIFSVHPDHAPYSTGNLVHFILTALAALAAAKLSASKKNKHLTGYGLCILLGSLLFCLFVKWHPKMARFHLPLFVLASAFAAGGLPDLGIPKRESKVWPWAVSGLALILMSGLIFYPFYGARLLQSMYEGRSADLLNHLMDSHRVHPVGYYLEKADRMFLIFLMTGFGVVSALVFLWKCKWRRVYSVSLLLFIFSVPLVFGNNRKYFFGEKNIFNTRRLDQYFCASPGRAAPYEAAVQYLKSNRCLKVGLLTRMCYPFYRLMDKEGGARLQYVNVKNISANAPLAVETRFSPCALIADTDALSEAVDYEKAGYRLTWSGGPLRIFLPED